MAALSRDATQGWRLSKGETARSQSFGDMKSFFKGPEANPAQRDSATSAGVAAMASNAGGEGAAAPHLGYDSARSQGGTAVRKPRSTSYDNVAAQVAAVAEEDENEDEDDSLPVADAVGHNDNAQFLLPRRFWQSDTEARGCSVPGCRKRFTFAERRHHCRKCGLAVCAACRSFPLASVPCLCPLPLPLASVPLAGPSLASGVGWGRGCLFASGMRF